MKRCCFWAAPALMLILQSPILAEGWKLPNLNPFSKSEEPPAAVEEESQSSWRLPSLPKLSAPKMPTWGASSRMPATRSKQPSTWDKMNQGTRQFLGKTKETLMPWSKSDSGNQRTPHSRITNKRKSEPKKGIFASVFGPAEEEKEIRTVNEFLSQPPVPFE